MRRTWGEGFSFGLRELNGALGDLGALLPLMVGTIAVVGLAPSPVLVGFAVFYFGPALCYRLPIPVQPMNAVVAVLLTPGITSGGLAAPCWALARRLPDWQLDSLARYLSRIE